MSRLSENHTIEFIQALPIMPEHKPKNEKEEAYLREIGEYEFFNLEDTGVPQKFPYGDTNKNHTFVFMHGGRYKIPRFIANHVESKATPRYDWRPDGTGRMTKQRTGDKPRFQMRQIYS